MILTLTVRVIFRLRGGQTFTANSLPEINLAYSQLSIWKYIMIYMYTDLKCLLSIALVCDKQSAFLSLVYSLQSVCYIDQVMKYCQVYHIIYSENDNMLNKFQFTRGTYLYLI